MSQSPSGNELNLRSYAFEVTDDSRVGEVRRRAQELAAHLGFTDVRSAQLSIIVNELANNLVRHADQGHLILRAATQFGERFVEIISVDRGPGFADLEHSFTDGVTTGSTPGTGLGAIRRQVDLFDAQTSAKGSILVCEMHATDESAQRARESAFRVSGICLPIGGEQVSGDAWTLQETHRGFEILVADGLGHGPIAHAAAVACVDAYSELASDMTLEQKLKQLHSALRSTRGASVSVANLASVNSDAGVDFAGVGNVRGVICEHSKDRTLLTHPGTVGLQFRPHPPVHVQWDGNGCFVMHSDGIQSRWNTTGFQNELDHHPAVLAATLYRDYTRGTDDLTVVCCRYGEGDRYK